MPHAGAGINSGKHPTRLEQMSGSSSTRGREIVAATSLSKHSKKPIPARRLLVPLAAFVAGSVIAVLSFVGYIIATDDTLEQPSRKAISGETQSGRGGERQRRLRREEQKLASARAREWASVHCGAACKEIKLVRRAHSLWEIDTRYVNGAEQCRLLNLDQFERRGALVRGVELISCDQLGLGRVPGQSTDEYATAAMHVRRWAFFNCRTPCRLTGLEEVSESLWEFKTRLGSNTCYLFDNEEFVESRGRFKGITQVGCRLPASG
jgi:hypothetical protein